MELELRLALGLGRTLEELRDGIGADELALWRELYRKSPWGSEAEDERTAVVCAVVNGSLGGSGAVKDFRIEWGGDSARRSKLLMVPFGDAMAILSAHVKKVPPECPPQSVPPP